MQVYQISNQISHLQNTDNPGLHTGITHVTMDELSFLCLWLGLRLWNGPFCCLWCLLGWFLCDARCSVGRPGCLVLTSILGSQIRKKCIHLFLAGLLIAQNECRQARAVILCQFLPHLLSLSALSLCLQNTKEMCSLHAISLNRALMGDFCPPRSPYSKFTAIPLSIEDRPNTTSERRCFPHRVCGVASP